MHIVLFFFYLILFSFVISRSTSLLKSKLKPGVMVGLFLFYCLAGCIHLWVAFHFYPSHGDIWKWFDEGLKFKHDLLFDFDEFRKDIFPGALTMDLIGPQSGWSSLQMESIMILNMILDFLSFDNIYINTLLFCFITLWGKVALFRLLTALFPEGQAMSLLLAFAVPGTVFWTSVIHKEGIIYCIIGLLLYAIWKILNEGAKPGTIFTVAICMVIIFIARKIVLLNLLPAVAIWWAVEKTSYSKIKILSAAAGLYLMILWLMAQANPAFNLLEQISEWQYQFRQLKGASRVSLPTLQPNATSFFESLPYAVRNGFLMPLPGMGGKAIYSLFGLEMIIIWLIVFYGLYYSIKKRIFSLSGFGICCLLFSISGLLVVGYTVPFAGAIIRYRSIFCPFLVIPFAGLLNSHPLVQKINKKLSHVFV